MCKWTSITHALILRLHTASLTASCSNSGPYAHVSLRKGSVSLLVLCSSILFVSSSFLFSVLSSSYFLDGFLNLLSVAPLFLFWFGSSSAGLKHHPPPPPSSCCSVSFPLHEESPVSPVLLVPLPLSRCFSLSVVYERQLSFLLFPSSYFFLPTCLRLSLSLYPSLTEPVGSQTERVSRGLERGIISLLLPPFAPPHSLSITVFIPPFLLLLFTACSSTATNTTQTVFHYCL